MLIHITRNSRAFEHPVVKARTKDGRLAYAGYADRAAERLNTSLDVMLDTMLSHGFYRVGPYYLTFADQR